MIKPSQRALIERWVLFTWEKKRRRISLARAPNARAQQAKELFLSGMKLIDISRQLNVPEGTVRRWKSTYKWESERSDKNDERSEKKRAQKEHNEKPIADEVRMVMENPELTEKQRLFCLYFVRSFNATKAYQKAYGCDYITACGHSSTLLKKVEIANEIHRLKCERMSREFLDEHDIVQKYMDIAFADITDYVEFGREKVPVMGAFGPVTVKDEATGEKMPLMQEVNTVKFRESIEVDGTLITEVKQGKSGASIKLADRMKALDWLAAHMNLTTDEQRAKIAQMKAQTDKLTGNNQEIEDMDEIEGEIYGERE